MSRTLWRALLEAKVRKRRWLREVSDPWWRPGVTKIFWIFRGRIYNVSLRDTHEDWIHEKGARIDTRLKNPGGDPSDTMWKALEEGWVRGKIEKKGGKTILGFLCYAPMSSQRATDLVFDVLSYYYKSDAALRRAIRNFGAVVVDSGGMSDTLPADEIFPKAV
jgi:hypothetical protein